MDDKDNHKIDWKAFEWIPKCNYDDFCKVVPAELEIVEEAVDGLKINKLLNVKCISSRQPPNAEGPVFAATAAVAGIDSSTSLHPHPWSYSKMYDVLRNLYDLQSVINGYESSKQVSDLYEGLKGTLNNVKKIILHGSLSILRTEMGTERIWPKINSDTCSKLQAVRTQLAKGFGSDYLKKMYDTLYSLDDNLKHLCSCRIETTIHSSTKCLVHLRDGHCEYCSPWVTGSKKEKKHYYFSFDQFHI